MLSPSSLLKLPLPQGNFHRYVKKNKRITCDSSRGKFYGLIKPQSGSTPWAIYRCVTADMKVRRTQPKLFPHRDP